MSIAIITALCALIVSILGPILNFYKLKNTQKTWENEQKISMEKALLFMRLEKRYILYANIFKLLGSVKDIEYPKEHHINIENKKESIKDIADSLLEELYGEAGLFMEYSTRTQILKTYQISYKYANNEVPLSKLIDSYYYARRLLRKDLEFNDDSETMSAQEIIKDKKIIEVEKKQKDKESTWTKKDILAHSSRPGYPNKVVPLNTLMNTINKWKRMNIKSIICLLSDDEINTYYESINIDLISFYRKEGFNVYHISIEDYQHPPVTNENMEKIYAKYLELEKPLLVHCGAGEDRTGQVTDFIVGKISV